VIVSFREIDHSGDVGLELWGVTLPDLLLARLSAVIPAIFDL
jgi:hypothetical protein